MGKKNFFYCNFLFSWHFSDENRLLGFARKNVSHKTNPFQSSVTCHVETSHLICSGNQMTCFYVKYNNRLKWVNLHFHLRYFKGILQCFESIYLTALGFNKRPLYLHIEKVLRIITMVRM